MESKRRADFSVEGIGNGTCVEVKLHGILRDVLPVSQRGQVVVEFSQGQLVADLLDHLGLKRRVIVSVNEETVTSLGCLLQDGDKIHVFTPMGGG